MEETFLNLNFIENIAKEYVKAFTEYEFDVYTLLRLENSCNEYFENKLVDTNFLYFLIRSNSTFFRILILRPRLFKELLEIQTIYGISEAHLFFKKFMEYFRLLAANQLKQKRITMFNLAQILILIYPNDFEYHFKDFCQNEPYLSLIHFLHQYRGFAKISDRMLLIEDFMTSLLVSSNKVHLTLKHIKTRIDINILAKDYWKLTKESETNFFDLCHIFDTLYSQFNENEKFKMLSFSKDLNFFCSFLANSCLYDLEVILKNPKFFQILLKLYVTENFEKTLSFLNEFYHSFQEKILTD